MKDDVVMAGWEKIVIKLSAVQFVKMVVFVQAPTHVTAVPQDILETSVKNVSKIFLFIDSPKILNIHFYKRSYYKVLDIRISTEIQNELKISGII